MLKHYDGVVAKGLKPAQMRTYFALTEAASLLQYAVREQLETEGGISYVQFEILAKLVDARLATADDEVDTLGGLVFLLTGHIPAKGESVLHSSGWRLEAVDSDPRKIVRVRLHAPEPAPSEPLPEK